MRILGSLLRTILPTPIVPLVFPASASTSLRVARASLLPFCLIIAALCLLPACKRKPPQDPPIKEQLPPAPLRANGSKTSSPPAKTADFRFSAKLHHAAQEMALDGFQFDKKAFGWPYDAGTKSAAEFLALLVKNSYLTDDDAAAASWFAISNLSDSDPGETAFLRTAPSEVTIVIVRKDGQIKSFANSAACDNFAPPPPRIPAWLP